MKRVRLFIPVALGAAILLATACDDRAAGLTGPTPQPTEVRRGRLDNVSLLSCAALPADTATSTVGAAGGVLHIGEHRLVVPAGALTAPTEITAIAPSDTLARVRLLPEGLTFERSVQLELSYAHCAFAWLPIQRRIVYLDDDLNVLEILVSLPDVWARTVSTRLDHFSDYAVAW